MGNVQRDQGNTVGVRSEGPAATRSAEEAHDCYHSARFSGLFAVIDSKGDSLRT